MSCYDKNNFKATNQVNNKSIKYQLNEDEFKSKFNVKYDNFSKAQIKDLINCENSELFDYMYSDEYVSSEFFKNEKKLKENPTIDESSDYLLNFLKEKYRIITPMVLKLILKEYDIGFNSDSDNDYSEMMKLMFKKSSLNLGNYRDALMFKYFLMGKDVERINEELNFPELKERKSPERLVLNNF